jgi:hypothetical protein
MLFQRLFGFLNDQKKKHRKDNCVFKGLPNKACSGFVGFCGFDKHFSSFGLFLLSNRIHVRPSAMLRERKPLRLSKKSLFKN